MNRIYKTLSAFLLCFAFIVAATVGASAAGTVTYKGDSKKFIFEPGSKYSPTDLFTEYKGVMPGDSIPQTIYVVNDPENEVKVDIYMRALGPTTGELLEECSITPEENLAFLSQLELTVDVRGGERLFKAPANETATLTDWVHLGTFYSGAKVTLDVTLELPISAGNEFANSIGLLDWEFSAIERPIEPDDPLPPTGDSNALFYCGLAAVSCAAVLLFFVIRKRRTVEEEA